MENEYIKSGLLFRRKKIGIILFKIAHNRPRTYSRLTKNELLFEIIEDIEGNIWCAYLSKFGVEKCMEEILLFAVSNKELLELEINENGWDGISKNNAIYLLNEILLK